MRISDVARHAGVSPSTVSYVLSGKRSISESTTRRVRESIEALGYQPHAGARSLASRRTSVIALVVPLRDDVHVPVAMRFAVSVVTAARTHDHDVLLLTQGEGPDGLRRVAGSAMVDGVIVMDVEADDARVPVLRSLGLPSVLIGVPEDTEALTCIDLDFSAAGALCVDHLADLGHTDVAFVGQPPSVYERRTGFAERTLAGFEAAVARRGLRATSHPCTPESARHVADALQRERPDLTGVIVHNEPSVGPLLDAFAEHGRSAPELSALVIGPSPLVPQPLTSVDLPAEELGGRAVRLLVDKIDGLGEPGVTLLEPGLTDRGSTAHRT
ncbi:LacI family transcriptional regulator [Nocardiopsis terrae]|uniref:DNA-binding LacI/PurR family transcriptional regulator n=1 Tax=Nocardiopsis terrae TaxID=372655 RepID=A0ABR9HAJ0_9ACTN|nr:LacI family DNA-binding transcriptional regulator [Nocardiopsis terrae]MBE1456046.1 DNA-binding LacI/PurR family transcriptional regulator [Nocardiopsis terrae]GHC96151.1 LacI family transcriptional regulator [Nocardiopsis terrae]